MIAELKARFKSNPQIYYALSICATWAGIGSLMNGVTMTQTYGVIPSLIWVLGNVLACIVFGFCALKIPKVREVFGSRIMKWICGIMCVFQAWLSMNGTQTVFADTPLGRDYGMFIAYAMAVHPTCVGMNRKHPVRTVTRQSTPHVRGDEPTAESGTRQIRPYTPRAWG